MALPTRQGEASGGVWGGRRGHVTTGTNATLASLVTNSEPRDREVEIARARAELPSDSISHESAWPVRASAWVALRQFRVQALACVALGSLEP